MTSIQTQGYLKSISSWEEVYLKAQSSPITKMKATTDTLKMSQDTPKNKLGITNRRTRSIQGNYKFLHLMEKLFMALYFLGILIIKIKGTLETKKSIQGTLTVFQTKLSIQGILTLLQRKKSIQGILME